MQTEDQLKELVKQKYAEIALQNKDTNQSSCCGASGCSTEVYNIMSEDYTTLEGYDANADLGLGCGLPTQFAAIKKGDVVIDLGSGAGNDAFIARAETGENGKVIGIDFTPAMIERARANAEQLKFHNVEFRQGDIEKMPVTANTADVIVSNCVLNLVPNKDAVLKEIFRVLKPGGHFSISDIVLIGEYLGLIDANKFTNVKLQKEKVINIPDDILKDYLDEAAINEFKSGATGIYSVTVYAEKPTDETCCAPGCCD
ncbi:MAG: arsenite methyltransferase [Chitinophagaceae bacterium]|nr:MAG: arsenite methyltransferase [Chitinophagaceae bacterium]